MVDLIDLQVTQNCMAILHELIRVNISKKYFLYIQYTNVLFSLQPSVCISLIKHFLSQEGIEKCNNYTQII